MSNPNTDTVIGGIVGRLAWPGTRVAANRVYVMDADQLAADDANNSASAAMWPAMLVLVNNQPYEPLGATEFHGFMDVLVQLWGNIDQTNRTIDQEWALLSADAEIVKSNVARNRSLVENNQAHAVDILGIRLSNYSGEQLGELQGMQLPHRDVLFTVRILPYDEI